MQKIVVFGIANCQTVQKAMAWLTANHLEFEFWDYKKQGIDREHLTRWCNRFGWEEVLNKAGMMWRKALDSDRAKLVDQESAIDFLLRTPTAIKRPIIEADPTILIGYSGADYQLKLL